MKKVLSTVAALGLAAGIATSASALELKVKGGYLLEGISVSNARGILSGAGLAMNDSDYEATDAWFQHKFTIDATMKVNDAISVKSRIRLVDYATVWGSQDDTTVGNGANFAVKRLWMIYKSPIGQWEIGRRPAGAWEGEFINNSTRADRIMWKSGKMLGDSFSMYAFYQKSKESDAYYATWADFLTGNINAATDDMDSDYYEVYGAFTGYGKTSLAFGYARDRTLDIPNGSSTDKYRIKSYGKYPLTDMLGLQYEFDYIWGDKDINNALGTSYEIDAFAFMTALDMNFGAATANLMYFYISGDSDGTDRDLDAYSSAKGTGNDFQPLYVLTGYQTSLLNNDRGAWNEYGFAARTAGAHGFVAAADFSASEKLAFHGAAGWAKAADERTGFDTDYGFELDAGASYKLLDNLTYNLNFGYLWTGDFFQMANPNNNVSDITILYNNISMSF
jgi:hypothetical protein